MRSKPVIIPRGTILLVDSKTTDTVAVVGDQWAAVIMAEIVTAAADITEVADTAGEAEADGASTKTASPKTDTTRLSSRPRAELALKADHLAADSVGEADSNGT